MTLQQAYQLLCSPLWRMTPGDIYWLTDWQIQNLYLKPTFDFTTRLVQGTSPQSSANPLRSPPPRTIDYNPDRPPVDREAWQKNYQDLGASPEQCERKWNVFLSEWRTICEAKQREGK